MTMMRAASTRQRVPAASAGSSARLFAATAEPDVPVVVDGDKSVGSPNRPPRPPATSDGGCSPGPSLAPSPRTLHLSMTASLAPGRAPGGLGPTSPSGGPQLQHPRALRAAWASRVVRTQSTRTRRVPPDASAASGSNQAPGSTVVVAAGEQAWAEPETRPGAGLRAHRHAAAAADKMWGAPVSGQRRLKNQTTMSQSRKVRVNPEAAMSGALAHQAW
ncbi:hypothetical protein QJQ45_004781 [Haematococcus lacustris]|nr:hypothetical protein QJQ45_004781 [Haematococcus lacustris]